MRPIITLLFFCVISLQAQKVQQLGFRLPDGISKVRIPIEIHNNLVVIPVVINGQLPLKFILDTGVRTAILTEKSYSDIIGLPYSRQYYIASPGGEHLITAYIANNVSLYIPPGIQGNGHALLVLEKDYLELRNFLGAEVHGVLGYELFSRFIVVINYEEKFIEVMNPDKFKPKRKFQRLSISIEDTKPFCKTEVTLKSKKELKFLIDTGASHGLMLDPESDIDIQVPEKNISAIIGRALGGEITGKIARVPAISLGKYSLQKVIANYPDANSYMDTLKASSVIRNGSIGGDILSRFTVIFNYAAGKMYLQKNSSFKKEFQNNLSGMTLKAKGAKLRTFEIIEVRPNSASGREGIMEGDIVVTVNGRPAASFNLSEINGELNSKAGKKLTFELDRAGLRVKKTIILKDEI